MAERNYFINGITELLILSQLHEGDSYVYIPAKQHNSPEGTACYSASNCTKCS